MDVICMLEPGRRSGRRLLVAVVVAAVAALGSAVMAAPAQAGSGMVAQESCWSNAFAWVSTSPSNKGNLSGIASCSPAVPKLSITMYVHSYANGSVVQTVGPVVNFNTQSVGVAYSWYCFPPAPTSLYGELRAEVTYAGGGVGTGTWYTPVLSC
jgi:hypothetical protein